MSNTESVGATLFAVVVILFFMAVGFVWGEESKCRRFLDRSRTAADSAFVASVCKEEKS